MAVLTFHSFDPTGYTGPPLSNPAGYHPSAVVITVLDRLSVRIGGGGGDSGRGRVIAVVQERVLHVWIGHKRCDAERVCPGRQRIVCIHGLPGRTYGDLPGGDGLIARVTPSGDVRLFHRQKPRDQLPVSSHGQPRSQNPSEVLLHRQHLSAFTLVKPAYVPTRLIGSRATTRTLISPDARFVRHHQQVSGRPPEEAQRELGRINVGIVAAATAASSYRGGPRFGGMARSFAIHHPVSVSGAAMKTCTWRGERPPGGRWKAGGILAVCTL